MAKDLVLIVEDEPEWQNRFREALGEDKIFELELASKLQSAIRKLQELDPSALVLDMKLNEGDYREDDWEGWRLADLAREQGIATVIVTGERINPRTFYRAYRDLSVVYIFDKGRWLEDRRQFVQRVTEAVETTRRRRLELNEKTTAAQANRQFIADQREVVQLQFENINGITVLRAFNSPQGEPRINFNKSFSEEGMQLLLKLIQENRIDFSSLEPKEKDLLQKFEINAARETKHDLLEQVGIQLYDSLAVEKVGTALTKAIDNLLLSNAWATLQIRLDENDVELAQYPWELIHDGYRFLVRDYEVSLPRYITSPLPVPRFQSFFPLRVLMVVTRPQGVPPLQDVEEDAIRSVVGDADLADKFEFVRLEPPVTYEHVLTALEDARRSERPFDILYYDGHSSYGWQCKYCDEINEPEEETCTVTPDCRGFRRKCEGFVFFEHESRQKVAIGASRLVTILSGSRVQIVALSACDTGKVWGQTLFSAVGPKIGQIIPAVIAMQFPIPISDTLSFFREFFKILGDNDVVSTATVEEAVKNARKHVLSDRWFYPVLYLRAK